MRNKRKLIACGLSFALILSMFPASGVSVKEQSEREATVSETLDSDEYT